MIILFWFIRGELDALSHFEKKIMWTLELRRIAPSLALVIKAFHSNWERSKRRKKYLFDLVQYLESVFLLFISSCFFAFFKYLDMKKNLASLYKGDKLANFS